MVTVLVAGVVRVVYRLVEQSSIVHPHNTPDVVVIDKVGARWTMIDFAVPLDCNVARTEKKKEDTYAKLAAAVEREQKVKVDIVPIVVGSMGVVTKDLVKNLVVKLGVGDIVGGLQTTALICTAAIGALHMTS